MTTEDEDMILHLRIKFSIRNGVQMLPPYIERSLSMVDSSSTSETEHPVATATEVQSMLSLLTSLVTGAANHSEQSLQQLSNLGSVSLMGEKKKGEDGSELRDHNRGGIAETKMEVDIHNLAGELVNGQVGVAPRTPPRQNSTQSGTQSPVRDQSQPVPAESRQQSSRSRSISKERIVSPRSTSSSLGYPPPISPTARKQSFDRQPTLPSHSPINPRSTRQYHQAPPQPPSNQQQLSSSRARLPSEAYYSQPDKYQHPKPEQVSVSVCNLPYEIDFEHVKRIFTERCGEISRSNFICDRSAGNRFTGRCFLEFVDDVASEKALELDGFVLGGRTIRVRHDTSSTRKGKRGYDDYSAHGNRGAPIRGQYDSFDQRHDQYNREQHETSRGKTWMPKRMRTESNLPDNDPSFVRNVDGDRSSYNLQNKDSRDSYPDTDNNGLNAEKYLPAEVLDSRKEGSPKESEFTRSLESDSAPSSQQEKTRRFSSSRQREKSPYPTSRPQTPPMDTLRTLSPVKTSAGTAESKAEENNGENFSSAAVVVSNLPKKMSEIMLFEFFGGCGEIKTINTSTDDRKAYIEFENSDDAQEALQLNGTKIEDTQIQVHPAKSEFLDDRIHNVVSSDYDKQMKDNRIDERAINDRGMRVDSGHDVRGRKFDFERERERNYEYRNEDTGRGRYRGRQRYDRRDNNRRTGSFREQDWDRDNRNREHRSGYHMTPSSSHHSWPGSIPKEREPDTDNFWSRDQDIRTLYVSGFAPDYDAVKLQALFVEKGLQNEVVEARIVIDPKDQMAKFGFVDIYSTGLQKALALHNTKHGENILKITESERPR